MPGAMGTERNTPFVRSGANQNFVKHAVVIALKHDDFISSSNGTRDAQSGHDRFRTGIAKCCAVHASEFAKELRDLPRPNGLRTDFYARFELVLNCVLDERGHMTEQIAPKPMMKSMYSFPSTSQRFEPADRADTMG